MTNIKIVTHDRVFHADETFAAATLRIAFKGNADLVRTRDPAMLRKLAGEDGTFLLDVGGRFEPDNRLFDHHQPEGAGYRNRSAMEWPYATSGLVWKYYGAQAVSVLHPELNEESVAEIVSFIDESFIKFIDAVDCGVRVKSAGPSISGLIASFNSSWYEDTGDCSFPLVLDLAQVMLTNFIRRYAGKILARGRVRMAPTILGGRVLVLTECLPWSTVVAQEMPDILYVAYPVDTGIYGETQWQARAAVNYDMSPRTRLPLHWGGLDGENLEKASGLGGAVFCHRSRHLVGACNKEALLGFVELAVEDYDKLQGKQLSLALEA